MSKPSTTLAVRPQNNVSTTTVAPRGTKQTHRARAKNGRFRWQRAFLKALRQTPNVQAAAKSAGVGRSHAYATRLNDEIFAAAWDDALGASIDKLEHKAFQLAMAGDSTLITFMLRCHKPSVYRDVQRMEIDARHCGVILMPQKEDLPP